jgi:dolichyl-phosphate mannosyltransferase polypeptide 2 regulatory subunit
MFLHGNEHRKHTAAMSLLFHSSALFIYYVLWVLGMVSIPPRCFCFTLEANGWQPFVDEDHPLHDLFPPREWAIKIPVVFILVLLAIIGTFVSMVMIKSTRDSSNGPKQVNGRRRAQRSPENPFALLTLSALY